MRVLYVLPTSVICLAIAAIVLLSGMHAKDLAAYGLPAVWMDAKKQATDAEQQIIKLTSELHDHSVKTVHVDTGTDGQADTRSLRLQDHKKEFAYRNRIAARLRLWWEFNSLHLNVS